MPKFLLLTVGGSPEPLVAALLAYRPDKIMFIVSSESRSQIPTQVLPLAKGQGYSPSPGQYELWEVADAQDFGGVVARLRELESAVQGWLDRGPEYEVVVDFTGGTKCMSAAAAVVGRRWSCTFSYVGGKERTKGQLGVVVSGKEALFERPNPWDALGYQAVEDFLLLFDQHAYGPAARGLEQAARGASAPNIKSELASLAALAHGYGAWDRFDHPEAAHRLDQAHKGANNLRHALGEHLVRPLLHQLQEHLATLQRLKEAGETPSVDLLRDLLGNAQRRMQERRYDDAVARYYRATEAYAQLVLMKQYGMPSTKHVPIERVPTPLRGEWASRAEDGELQLGLQDDYRLLEALGAGDVCQRFRPLRDLLGSRNQSILAHGFTPVREGVAKDLGEKVLALCQLKPQDLVSFPQLSAK